MAIAALTAACLVPAAAGAAADLRACAGGARCGSVTVPLLASDPTAGNVSVGFEVYSHRRGAKARDTILVSAGSDGVPTTAGRDAVLALLGPLRDRRDIVLVDARGTGRSGRVGDHTEAYGAGAAAEDLDAVRGTLGIDHVEVYGAGDGARIALAYAARHGDRIRALVLDGGPRATLLSGNGHAEAHALARALGHEEPVVARLAARLRTHPLHDHGRIDDDVLARIAAHGDAGTLGQLPGRGDRRVARRPRATRAARARSGACPLAPGGTGAGELLPRRRGAGGGRSGGRRAVQRGDLAQGPRAGRLSAEAQRGRPRAAGRRGAHQRPCARARG